jgi:hypothetical protein
MPQLGMLNKALCKQKMFSGKAGKKMLGQHMKTIKTISVGVWWFETILLCALLLCLPSPPARVV